MVISVSATIISKREITVSNPEIIFNSITSEMTSDAEGMDFTTGKMTSEMSKMISITREMKTDAVVTTPTFAAVTTITASQTIIIAKTY
ncbi:unknown [Prevotella sp. CAG:474]|nr:unknown [Prevotella sp. CAG:474]